MARNIPRIDASRTHKEEIIVSTAEDDDWEEERVLATNNNGESLTLLEEYAKLHTKPSRPAFYLAFASACASLVFAYFNFIQL